MAASTNQEWRTVQTTTEPYLQDLQFKGFIEGSCIKDKSSGKKLCYYFGGLPYALPPIGPFRWQRPRPLPPCYRYGTRANPGRYTGLAGVCPQIGRNERTSPTELFDEDCLQLNIWIPHGEAPKDGWPVYFFIHGGFLQFGNPNMGNPAAFLSETDCQFIVVKVGYRVGIFGFLASQEMVDDTANKDITVGNLGLWDIRLALEWTHQNISYFGGNPSNITVGGYSAGSYCTFYQLQHDIALPASKQLIKRAIMHSNGTGVEPKSLQETQHQFDELLHRLDIPLALSATEKLARLRQLPWNALLAAVSKMEQHQFRGVLDNAFISRDLFPSLLSGSFARRLRAANVALLVGECVAEHHVYGTWQPPAPGLANLAKRLHADYPRRFVDVLLLTYFPDGRLPPRFSGWTDAFGRVYADVQVHVTQRGLTEALVQHGAGHLLHRYFLEYRVGMADMNTPREWGATHAADMFIWWWGEGYILEDGEKEIVKRTLLDGFARFVKGEDDGALGGKDAMSLRRVREDGSVDDWKDEWWNEKIGVWRALSKAMGKEDVKARL